MSALHLREPVSTHTAPDLLRLRAARHPDRTPISVEGSATLTFGEWARRSEAVAHALLGRGVRRGDRVALLFGALDWVDYAVAYFGVLEAGGTAVHLCDELPPDELRRRLAQCAVTGIVHGTALASPAGFAGWAEPVSALDRDVRVAGRVGMRVGMRVGPEDIADILYTSGTTGPAKAFTNPHGTLTFGRGPAGLAKLDVSAPMLAPMPMGTASSAMTVGMMALNSPSTVVLCRPGDVERMAELIARHRIATLLLTPWIAMQLVAARVHERHDLTSVTTVAVASAPLPPATARALAEQMPGVVITTAFAQGEAVPAVVLNVFDPARPTAVGRPGAGTELRVVGEDGEPVPDGEIGEIWLRSAAPKRLYLDEALNRQVHAGGWTRTRDLGYIGTDGDLYLFDRAVDAIRTQSQLVSSIAVELALYDHPAVREAAVVGVPDPDRGQAVVALLVLDSGADPDASATSLLAFLAGRLAPHQVPAAVHLMDALPRGVTGKVLKHDLRARLVVSGIAEPGRRRQDDGREGR